MFDIPEHVGLRECAWKWVDLLEPVGWSDGSLPEIESIFGDSLFARMVKCLEVGQSSDTRWLEVWLCACMRCDLPGPSSWMDS